MEKIEVHCIACNCLIGKSELFAFYDAGNSSGLHFVVKHEKKNQLGLKIVDQPVKKEKGFSPQIMLCPTCDVKLGSNSRLGPKGLPMLSFKKHCLYFVQSRNGSEAIRHEFSSTSKWLQHIEKFPLIERRNESWFGKKDKPASSQVLKLLDLDYRSTKTFFFL